MVRLLWLLDTVGIGGAEALVLPFARRLDRSRYALTVAALNPRDGETMEAGLRELGVDLVGLHARSLRDRAAFRRLRALAAERQIELVHSHLTFSAMWGSALSRLTGVPSIASLHVTPFATRQFFPTLRHRLATDARDWLMRKMLARWSSRVVTVSESLRQTYLAPPAGLPPSKVEVIHNGIELAKFARDRHATRAELERAFDIPASAPIAVTVAVLRPAKGIEVLLEAVRHIPGACFLIIGDGPSRGDFERLAATLGVTDRIRWAGYRTDVHTLLAGADLFVHPSLTDAFPTVLLEAAAAGLPVVSSNVGGIPEIVLPGQTGRLIPPGDAAVLAASISNVLADRAALRAMGERAREHAMRNFSVDGWVERMTALYDEVLAGFTARAATVT